MGWDFYRKPTNVKDEINSLWAGENATHRQKALETKIVNMREAYTAVERIDKQTGERRVFAGVTLIQYRKNTYFNFGVCVMDENMGPYYFNCPESIMAMLTETTHENAVEWREACRANIEYRKENPKGRRRTRTHWVLTAAN